MMPAIRKLLKDLLYTQGNAALDIARLSSLVAVIAYWTGVFVHMANGGGFDPVEVGAGWTAIAAGGGGWIYVRQKKEGEAEPAAPAARPAPEPEMV